MSGLLEIRTLGGLRLRLEGKPFSGLSTRKVEATLVYLACTGRQVPREAIAAMLWDERPQAQAMTSLRAALTNLRRHLSAYVQINRHTIRLSPEANVWLDVAEVEERISDLQKHEGPASAAEAQTITEAVALYRGDFLTGFYVRDAPDFEEWVTLERERLWQLVVGALDSLVAYHLNDGNYQAGLPLARKLLGLDPLMESAQRQTMRLLAYSGQRGAAVSQFETFRDALAEELGMEPTAETQALYEVIRAGQLTGGVEERRGRVVEVSPGRPEVINNLPSQPTRFIGREGDVAGIIQLLEDQNCRLLTLVGPGGIGKTRLSIEVATRLVSRELTPNPGDPFPDGVCFVPLQSVASIGYIIPAIAGAVGFEFYEAHHPERQLINYIGSKQLLLILDNLEHLSPMIGDDGDPIGELLAGAPGLKILATSRESLNMHQEWLFHVEGMALPQADDEAIETFDAVQLFVERARRVRHAFTLAEEKACVVRLCRLVDGMPLAIELSAAWLKRLGCAEIVSEIQRNLDVLETTMRGVPERHRSMRVVFDYSWQLLSQKERELFMKLSVFQGGFRREAAEQIAGASLRTLSALVDKSMVVAGSGGRYQIHELQRQYGAEHLGKAPEIETAVRNQHCEYFAALMGRPKRDYNGYGRGETLAEIDAEIDNLLSAWHWAVAQGRFGDLRQSISGLYGYWYARWHQGVEEAFHDGLEAIRNADPGLERDIALGWMLAHQSGLDRLLGRIEIAKERAEESIAILERFEARRELAHAYQFRAGIARWERGRDPEEARALMLRAASLAEETGQQELQASMYAMLGGLHYDVGQYREGEKWSQKALELSRKIDNPHGQTWALAALGRLALELGEYAKARQFLLESQKIARALKLPTWINEALARLGRVAMAVGDLEAAERYHLECVAKSKQWGKPYSIVYGLVNLADVLSARQQYERATDLYNETMQYPHGSRIIDADRLSGLGRIAHAKGEHTEARRLHQESQKICKENGYRLQMARNGVALGRIALAQDQIREARSHFREALAESVSIGAPPIMLEGIIGVGELADYEGDRKVAAALAQLVVNHPASRAESRERAAQILSQVDFDTSGGPVRAKDEPVARGDLESVAEKLLARLAA